MSDRSRFAVAVAVCMLLAAVLRPFPAQFKFRHGGDCVRYLTWSQLIAGKDKIGGPTDVKQRGLAAYPAIVAEYHQRWIGFPQPLRWVWIGLAALLMKVWTAPQDVYHPLVLLSWLGGVLALLPLALWLRRSVPLGAILLALVLLATAPVERALSHFPVPDSLGLLFSLGLAALVAAWLARPRRGLLVGLGVVATGAVALQEKSGIAVVAACALLVLDRLRGGRWRLAPLVAMIGGGVVALVIALPLAGGLGPLMTCMADAVRGAMGTGNAALVSGPWYRYFVDWMIVSPVVVLTAALSVVPLLKRQDVGPVVEQVLVFSLVVLGLFCFLPKAMRYVISFDVGLRVIAALAIHSLWQTERRSMRFLAAGLLVALVVHDEFLYQLLWGKDQIYDPLTWNLSRQLHLIP